jgi:hypothetical protein
VHHQPERKSTDADRRATEWERKAQEAVKAANARAAERDQALADVARLEAAVAAAQV